jgi:hypothetical protein
MIKDKLAKIREAAEKATQGDWHTEFAYVMKALPEFSSAKHSIANVAYPPDKNYIAIANPSTMLQLLNYIQDLEKCVGVQGEALKFIEGIKKIEYVQTATGIHLIELYPANYALTTVAEIMEKYKDE